MTRFASGLAALALLLAACTSDPPAVTPAAAPCDTIRLSTGDLAVLLRQFPDGGNDLAGMDVTTGTITVACPLPSGWVTDQGLTYTLPMAQDGQPYKDTATRREVWWRTQWFSPDFRWSTRPSRHAILDVAANRTLDPGVDGDIVGVTTNSALVKRPSGWCLLPLPPASPCTGLPPHAEPGAYVLTETATPTWIPAAATEIPLGTTTAYVLTDGTRLYRAELFPAALSTKDNQPSAILDATGRALFPPGPSHAPPGFTWTDWFTLAPGPRLTPHQLRARDNDPVRAMLLSVGSRVLRPDGSLIVAADSRFGVVDDDPQILPITCQAHSCHILTWPEPARS